MIIHLAARVASGRWDDLVAFLQRAIPFYEGPGGIKVRLLRDQIDTDSFIEVIEYDSDHAYAADQIRVDNDPEMISRLREWHALLATDVKVHTYRDVTPFPGTIEPNPGDPP